MCCWFASERCIWFLHDAEIFASDLCVFSSFFWVGSGMLRFVAIYVWKCRALLTLLACHHRRRQNSQFCTTSVGLSNLQGAKNCSSQVLHSFFFQAWLVQDYWCLFLPPTPPFNWPSLFHGVCVLLFLFRMTLLLGPPSAGKTTLLLALAGKLDSDLKVRTFGVALNQTKMPLFL